MNQACVLTSSAESVSTVFENVFELNVNIQQPTWKSKTFHAYSTHDGGTQVSWHYVINVTQNMISAYFVTIRAVIDACSTTLDASVELAPTKSNLVYKVTAKTKVGSIIGDIVLSTKDLNESFNFLYGPKISLRLKFSLQASPLTVKPVESKLPNDFASLFSNEQLADVTIVVGQRKFYAQRAILSVRCAVFAAMFQSGMQEATRNQITIEDIQPEVFLEVLRFIYTERVQGLEEMAHDLLAAADKYGLDNLKRLCEDQLRAGITKETVLQSLALADLYHAQELKDQAIQFVCANIKWMPTADWETLCTSRPALAALILRKIAES